MLKREYPKGVDVVYESVGGDMFATAVDALAPRGRLVIIGMMASYQVGLTCCCCCCYCRCRRACLRC